MNGKKSAFASLIFCFLCLGLPDVPMYAQQHNGYVLIGSISGLKDGLKVKLFLESMRSQPEAILDSTVVINGTFKLTGRISNGPRRVILKIDRADDGYERRFMLDNEQVFLRGVSGNPVDRYFATDTSFHISGGESENEYNILLGPQIIWNSSLLKLRDYFQSLTDTGKYDRHTMEALEKEKRIFVTEVQRVFRFNLNNRCLPYFYLSLPKVIACDSFFVAIYHHLPDNIKNSYYGTFMKKELRCSEGDQAPDFTSLSNEGSMISLKKVISTSKLTIVDFWGYSCAPCRKEFRKSLVPLYQQYHNKGLNVIGVSWDDYKSENWRKAITDDNLTWYQVTGQNIFDLYNLDTFPSNVIIDEHGKIIARNVFGVELNWLLDEYLNKSK